jgi:hypothetical protein
MFSNPLFYGVVALTAIVAVAVGKQIPGLKSVL